MKMNKAEMQKELDELITRFRRLKKAMAEEDSLSPAQRAATSVANMVKGKTLTRERVLELAKGLAEQQQAQRLANQLQKSGILGTRPPPRQPTSEEMQMAAQNMWAQQNGFSSQEEMNKAEANWGNGINNWLAEAVKPINQRFKSEQEEREYWDRIKINDNGRGGEGY